MNIWRGVNKMYTYMRQGCGVSKFSEGIDYSFGMHIPPEPIAFTFLKILIYPCLMYFLEKSLQQIRIKVKIQSNFNWITFIRRFKHITFGKLNSSVDCSNFVTAYVNHLMKPRQYGSWVHKITTEIGYNMCTCICMDN